MEWIDRAVELVSQVAGSVTIRGDTDLTHTEQLDRWDDAGRKFILGFDANPKLVGLAEGLETGAWQPLDRLPKYEILTEPRPKAFRYKEQVVVERQFENKKFLGEDLAEIEYQASKCKRKYRLIILRKNISVQKGEKALFDYALPQMVEAVLLPFKGQIIYDGLLSGYRVHFCGGIRSDINHTYTVARHKKRVISTLEPDQSPPLEVRPRKNILPQLKEVSATMSKLKSASALQNSALALARACLEVSVADAERSLSPDEIDVLARKVHKSSSRLLNLFQLMEEE